MSGDGSRSGAGGGSLADVSGIRVGHAGRAGDGWLTGVTVVLPPPGTRGAVDARGGATCTSETDALGSGSVNAWPTALMLTGGSALGLPAVSGVHRWCLEHGRGFPVGPLPGQVVPVVPAAGIFDLGRGGRADAVPDAALAYAAAQDASGPRGVLARRGRIGAGTGARVDDEGGLGGIGAASVRVPIEGAAGGATVAALAVVNAFGRPDVPYARSPRGSRAGGAPLNTTLVVVATDAGVGRGMLTRLATMGHDGMARALDPVHTLADGDVVFALSTGAVPLPPEGSGFASGRAWRAAHLALQAAAARVCAAAIRDGAAARAADGARPV
jgi:L-aminopeptidase/D-esterase-like protein